MRYIAANGFDMATNNRICETEHDRKMLIRFIEGKKLPFTASLADGKHRTTLQNRLQRQWMNDIAEQEGETAEYWRGYCKLVHGVPILRNENDAFAMEYDAVIKPLPYEAKLRLMQVPFDFGITRLMTTKQKTAYLDAIHREFSERGVILTNPEDLKFGTRRAA